MKYRLIKETTQGVTCYFTEAKCSDLWQFVTDSLSHDEATARATFTTLVETGALSKREILNEGEYRQPKDCEKGEGGSTDYIHEDWSENNEQK